MERFYKALCLPYKWWLESKIEKVYYAGRSREERREYLVYVSKLDSLNHAIYN